MRRKMYAALALTIAAMASTPARAQHESAEFERFETRADAPRAHDQPNLEEMIGGIRHAIGVIREQGHERAEAEFTEALERLLRAERGRAEFRHRLQELEERAADLAAAGRRQAVQEVTNEMRKVAQQYERTGERNRDRVRELLAEARAYLARFEHTGPRAREQRRHAEERDRPTHAAPLHTPPPHAESPPDSPAGHVRQAVEHLMAAGMPDLAKLIERKGAAMLEPRHDAPGAHDRRHQPGCKSCGRRRQPQRAHHPRPEPPRCACPHRGGEPAHQPCGNHDRPDEACTKANNELAGRLDQLAQRVERLSHEVARLSQRSRERD